MKEHTKRKLAAAAILLAGSLWGSMGLFVRKYNAKGMSSLDIVAVRAVVTAIFMLVFLSIYDRKLLKVRIKDFWCFAGTGLCSIVFFNYCYFKTITMTSMSVAAVLLYTAPAMVMMMSRVLFKERFTEIKLVALIATFAGCVFVTGVIGDTGNLTGAGILVGLGAGFGYAMYSIFSRFALERGYESLTISCYTFLFAAAGLLPFADGKKDFLLCTKSADWFLFTICFGLVSTVFPYILYTYGLKYIENGRASILASVEPVVATLLGIIIYHEKMTANGLIGMVLILGAIVLCNTLKQENSDCKKQKKT